MHAPLVRRSLLVQFLFLRASQHMVGAKIGLVRCRISIRVAYQ